MAVFCWVFFTSFARGLMLSAPFTIELVAMIGAVLPTTAPWIFLLVDLMIIGQYSLLKFRRSFS